MKDLTNSRVARFISACSVKQIYSSPRTPSVGLPCYHANAAHAGWGFNHRAAMTPLIPHPSKHREDKAFWDKVKKGQTPDDCWEWQGRKNKGRYGVIIRSRNSILAHRAAWLLTHGKIPDGLHILHHCDNPPCVNPKHLWCGTHSDNMADMARKGRGGGGEKHKSRRYPELIKRGEQCAMAKLSENIVRQIRDIPYYRGKYSELARQLTMSKEAIRIASLGLRWKHIK